MGEKIRNFVTLGNKFWIYLNLIFLESYLIRFELFQIPLNIQEILILLSGIFFLGKIILEKNFLVTFRNLKSHWIISGFLIITIFAIMTRYPGLNEDFIRHGIFLFSALILCFVTLETLKTSDERKKIMQVMGIGAILFGLFSFNYNIFGFNVTPDFRLNGPLDSAVYLAYYLAPFFIYFVISGIENPREKNNFVNALILFVLILLTRSMGAIGGSFLIIALYLFKKQNIKILKNKFVKILIAIILIGLSVLIFYTKIYPSFQTKWTSLNERNEIWQTSIELLKEPKNFLLGLGFGQFQPTYETVVTETLGRPPLDDQVLQPHNIFLLFIFNYGLLGLIFLILIIIELAAKILAKLPEKLTANHFASFILLYFLLHGMIDTPFFKNDLLILIILFAEIALTNRLSKMGH